MAVEENDSGMDSQEGSAAGSGGGSAGTGSAGKSPGSASDNVQPEGGSGGGSERRSSMGSKGQSGGTAKDQGSAGSKELEKSEPGEYDDEPDETLGERLWGLTEMFPEPVRDATSCFVDCAQKGIKCLYGYSRTAFWVVFSSSIILFAPVIFEVERAQMEEMQRTQQKQMLLGPNTAVSGGGLPLIPPPMQGR